jgi:hypothetical protein
MLRTLFQAFRELLSSSFQHMTLVWGIVPL